jgi:Domain of unknown function (DUF4252)
MQIHSLIMMKKLILVFFPLLLISCGVKTPYDTFRKEHRKDIDISLGASSFLAHLFMDNEDIKEYKEIVDGISKYRVLISHKNTDRLNQHFKDFVAEKGYKELFYVKDDEATITLYLYKHRNKIREVIFKVNNTNDFVMVSAEGNLKIKINKNYNVSCNYLKIISEQSCLDYFFRVKSSNNNKWIWSN